MRFQSPGGATTHPARAIVAGCLSVLAAAAASAGEIPIVTEAQKLLASDGMPSDKFGLAVDREGDTLVIGAPQHYTNSLPGSFYIFTRDKTGLWSEQERIFSDFEPGEAEFGDVFGTDVALEGDTLLVGAPFAEHNGQMLVGLVYVFTRDAAGAWTQQQTLLPDDLSVVRFGEYLEVVGDTAVIAGLSRVFIFSRDTPGGGVWSQQGELSGIPFASVGSIAFDGQKIIVGNGSFEFRDTDPQGLAFVNSDGQWQLSAPMNTSVDGFMTAVRDISLDGDQAVLGVLDLADQDRAFVFNETRDSAWAQQAMLDPNDIDDSFGADVALKGNLLLVGAPNAGTTYLYTRNAAGAWSEHLHLKPSDFLSKNFGDEMHFQDGLPIIGSWAHHENGLYSGAVYVFDEIQLAGDVTGDGVIDIDDLLAVIAAWGDCPPPPPGSCPADLDGDGAVSVNDLLIVISAWG